MGKGIEALDVVIKAQPGGSFVFEMKEPEKVNKALLTDIKKEISEHSEKSVVIYPDQKIIDTQRVIIDSESSII